MRVALCAISVYNTGIKYMYGHRGGEWEKFAPLNLCLHVVEFSMAGHSQIIILSKEKTYKLLPILVKLKL